MTSYYAIALKYDKDEPVKVLKARYTSLEDAEEAVDDSISFPYGHEDNWVRTEDSSTRYFDDGTYYWIFLEG